WGCRERVAVRRIHTGREQPRYFVILQANPLAELLCQGLQPRLGRGGGGQRLNFLLAEIPDGDLGQIWLFSFSAFEKQRFEMLHIVRRQAGFPRVLIAERNHRPPMRAANRGVRAVRTVALLPIAPPSFFPRDKRIEVERFVGLHRLALVLTASAK